MPPRRTLSWLVIALGLGVLSAPLAAHSQEAGKIPRIGFLGATSTADFASRVEELRAGLRDLGYVEGKNLIIEFRWAEGHYERLPALAAELVGLPVDLLVSHGTAGTWAAKRATTTIPIVMVVSGDAVATGLVASLARSGSNITGTTYFSPELHAKGLELLKEAVPRIRRVAILVNPDNSQKGPVLQALALAARSLKLELQQFEARGPTEFESAFAAMRTRRVDGLELFDDALLNTNARGIAALAAKGRLPSMGVKDFAGDGGLMGYGVDFFPLWRHAAAFVDKILKGAKLGDLPVEQAIKFELVINLKTAKALGLTIPQSLLLRADEVIQ